MERLLTREPNPNNRPALARHVFHGRERGGGFDHRQTIGAVDWLTREKSLTFVDLARIR
jgi:hypothetical protein